MPRGIIVTGIHTGIGKTQVAGALAAGLGWAYWKPIQTGAPADRDTVSRWGIPTYPERYRLALPAAPLIAAQAEGIEIDWEYLRQPPPAQPLIIEGAGGLFVPVTPTHFLIDLFAEWKLPLILVVQPYLGAMNHTWLSLQAILLRGLPFLGIVLNGAPEEVSKEYFRRHLPVIGEIPWRSEADPYTLFRYGGLEAALLPILSSF